MESLEYMVDKVTQFFLSTLPNSRVGGPFSPSQLQDMFTAAHFCADLTSGSLPPSYHQAVEQLQAQFPLLAASQQLLLSLGDNVRVNRQALDTARKLHDKQVDDLDSWLYCKQRNQLRDQFLLATQAVKGTEQWKQLRSYMCLVELARKDDRGLERLVNDRTDRMLGALLIKDPQYVGTQQKIVQNLSIVMTLDKLEMLDKKVLAKVISEKTEIVKMVVKAVSEALNNVDGLDLVDRVADILASILRLIKSSVLTDILGNLERGIRNRFLREELTNILVVKLKLGNRIEE